MKKPLAILISVFLLTGCSSQDNDFALKETCAKYVKDAQTRGAQYEGTYYSKGKSTCVSVYSFFQDGASGGRKMSYYDEFTGTWGVEFEKELQLEW